MTTSKARGNFNPSSWSLGARGLLPQMVEMGRRMSRNVRGSRYTLSLARAHSCVAAGILSLARARALSGERMCNEYEYVMCRNMCVRMGLFICSYVYVPCIYACVCVCMCLCAI